MKPALTKWLRNIVCLLAVAIGLNNNVTAQYVTIPDSTFASWLQSNGFAACMNGNQLDTTCTAVLGAIYMNCNKIPIRDLTGVQYFKNLTSLDCSGDSLYTIPALPPLLTYFNCGYNNLTVLPALPDSISIFYCTNNLLTTLPVLPVDLTNLECDTNELSSLPAIPSGVTYLTCDSNLLTGLPVLPALLSYLSCSYNHHLITLPALPDGLITLYCHADSLTSLPVLPAHIQGIDCGFNQLTSLPALPSSIAYLICGTNMLGGLPALPASLIGMDCSYNQIAVMPALPSPLTLLICNSNLLHSLPAFPAALTGINCSQNLINEPLPALPAAMTLLACSFNTNLNPLPALPPLLNTLWCNNDSLSEFPPIPSGLYTLVCSSNQLTNLSYPFVLPDSMYIFACSYNPRLTCLPALTRIVDLYIAGTEVTCLPDYGNVTTSDVALNTFSLCSAFNPSHCELDDAIVGALNAQAVFTVYPNPAKNMIIAETGQGSLGEFLQLSDLSGRELAKLHIEDYRTQIPLGNMAPGVYFLKMTGSGGGGIVKRIVVE